MKVILHLRLEISSEMTSSENETISLDHIHPKPANLGEQLSITGSRDLLTAANRSSRSRRRVMVILVSIAVAISAIIAASYSLENTFRNTLVVITGKVSIRCHSSFAIYSEVNNKSDVFEQKIEVGRNFSTSMAIVDVLVVEINRLILTLHHKLTDKINQ